MGEDGFVQNSLALDPRARQIDGPREKKGSIFETQTTPTDFLFSPLHTFGPPARTASRAVKGRSLSRRLSLRKEREREKEGRRLSRGPIFACLSCPTAVVVVHVYFSQ